MKIYSASSSVGDGGLYSVTATYTSGSHNYETEGNNSLASAEVLQSGYSVTAYLSAGGASEVDYFRFDASGRGIIEYSFRDSDTNGSDAQSYTIKLLDSGGSTIASHNTASGFVSYFEFTASNTYYVSVESSDAALFDGGEYIISLLQRNSAAREYEGFNNRAAFVDSDTLTSGTQITGQFSSASDDDYYKLSVSGSGTISVSFADTGVGNDEGYSTSTFDMSILDSSSNVLSANTFDDSGTLTANVGSAGLYYIKMSSSASNDYAVDNDDYNITATYSSTSASRENELNNSLSAADTLTSGTQITGQFSSASDDDYYKLSVSGSGTISVSFADTGVGNDEGYSTSTFDMSILDSSSNVLSANTFDDSGTLTANVGSAGLYYIKMSSSASNDYAVDNDDYNITATYSSTSASRENELNNSLSAADTLTSGTQITGQFSSASDDDYYKLSVSGSGTISVSFADTGVGNDEGYSTSTFDMSILDSSSNVLSANTFDDSGTLTANVGSAGLYYIKMSSSASNDYAVDNDDYNITATYSSTSASRENELNNSLSAADTLTSGTQITGQFSSASDDDYYKLSVSGSGTISVSFADTGVGNDEGYSTSTFDMSILDSSSNVLSANTFDDSGTLTANVGSAGLYYIKMSSSASNDYAVDNDDYNITATYSSTSASRENELNNSLSAADTLTSGTQITGQFSSASDDDYYKLSVSGSGTISVSFADTGVGNDEGYSTSTFDMSILDSSSNVLSANTFDDSGTLTANVGSAGLYYIKMSSSASNDYAVDNDDYNITATFS